MKIKKCAKIPTFNLAKPMHNEWLQHSGNKMICLYKMTMANLIHVFIQVANYRSWLKNSLSSKGLNSTFLNWRQMPNVQIPSCLQMPWSLIPEYKILILRIVLCRALNCLHPPNISLMCHLESIAYKVNIIPKSPPLSSS